MSRITVPTSAPAAWPVDIERDEAPPGERYYRHPGDVVRLVVWTVAGALLVLVIDVASGTSQGLRSDLSDAAAELPLAERQLVLAIVQIAAVVVPVAALAVVIGARRWRRTATVLAAATGGVVVHALLGAIVDDAGPLRGALSGDSWLVSTRFPSPAYVAGAFAAGTVAKPWMSCPWRRALDAAIVSSS